MVDCDHGGGASLASRKGVTCLSDHTLNLNQESRINNTHSNVVFVFVSC